MYCYMQLCVLQLVKMEEYVHPQDSVRADTDGLEVDVIFVSYVNSDQNILHTHRSTYALYMCTIMYLHTHTHQSN